MATKINKGPEVDPKIKNLEKLYKKYGYPEGVTNQGEFILLIYKGKYEKWIAPGALKSPKVMEDFVKKVLENRK